MKTRLLLLAILALAGFQTAVHAGPCTMTPAKAPALFGFKLGMSQSAAEKMTGQKAKPGSRLFELERGKKYLTVPRDDMYIVINNEKHESKLLDNTVEDVTLNFFDGKLFAIAFRLNQRSQWVTAPDTLDFFQQKFRIPVNSWVENPNGFWDLKKMVICNGVTIRASAKTNQLMRFDMVETAVEAGVEAATEAAKKKLLESSSQKPANQ